MGVQAREELLRGGERAIAAADWETARACLERTLEEGDSPDALTGLSKVAMIEREYERAIELRERAFDLYKAAGQLALASDSAIWLTFMYAAYHGTSARLSVGRSVRRACSTAPRRVLRMAG